MREGIAVYEGMKPTMLFAKGSNGYGDWLILTSEVEKRKEILHIDCFVCISVTEGFGVFFGADGKQGWGNIDDRWTFYIPTDEEKQKIVKVLTERGYKFVSVLNKLVKKA